MTITLAPGYLLSRSKEKINVTITDEFFLKDGTTKVSSVSVYKQRNCILPTVISTWLIEFHFLSMIICHSFWTPLKKKKDLSRIYLMPTGLLHMIFLDAFQV